MQVTDEVADVLGSFVYIYIDPFNPSGPRASRSDRRTRPTPRPPVHPAAPPSGCRLRRAPHAVAGRSLRHCTASASRADATSVTSPSVGHPVTATTGSRRGPAGGSGSTGPLHGFTMARATNTTSVTTTRPATRRSPWLPVLGDPWYERSSLTRRSHSRAKSMPAIVAPYLIGANTEPRTAEPSTIRPLLDYTTVRRRPETRREERHRTAAICAAISVPFDAAACRLMPVE
jgi:hypothetical protein